MARIGGLGKGMAALLQGTETVDESKNYFICPIEKIRPNRNQPRKHFSAEKLEELAASIREQGIIQPLVVTRKDDGYEIIAGERRWRAAQKAGLHEIPVVIREATPDAVMELALIENIQRQDLNAIEEALAYRSLVEHFSISQEDVARRVGKNRTTVTNALRLLKLPEDIQKDIVEERLSMGHARALLSLDSGELIDKARHEILHRQLSVRATLARHGVACEAEVATSRHGNVGDALISHCERAQADLLVMGCYGHSRLREVILGGATRDVLANMTIPVLMSH